MAHVSSNMLWVCFFLQELSFPSAGGYIDVLSLSLQVISPFTSVSYTSRLNVMAFVKKIYRLLVGPHVRIFSTCQHLR